MPNTTFVIFGISSDLSKIKLLPAIYHLIKDKKVTKFSIVGMASSEYTVDFLIDSFAKEMDNPDNNIINKMKKNMVYLRGDFEDPEVYVSLKNILQILKRKNILYYLATLPIYFKPITFNLKKNKLNKEKKNWVRIVFEKPFGNDLQNAKELNKCIGGGFKEKQVFRIDHYLGKELVQNISILRFTNILLEPLWGRNNIDHVQIILNEEVGIGKRAKFYDKYGVTKDIIQNHALQLLALIAMKKPWVLQSEYLRNEKHRVLKYVQNISPKNCIFGQYASYKNEKGVKEGTKTATFAAMKLFINNDRWKGVPFYIKAGKKLKKKEVLIYIQFKNRYKNNKKQPQPNYLVITVQPSKGFYMVVNIKEPRTNEIKEVKMNFVHEDAFDVNTPEAYETLFDNVLNGDQSVFVRSDEIEESWRIIEDITKEEKDPLIYRDNTDLKEANYLIEKDGRKWFR